MKTDLVRSLPPSILTLATVVACSGGSGADPDAPPGADLSASAAEEAMAADREFAEDAAARGVDGWVAWFEPDGIMVSGGEEIVGRDAIRSAMAPVFADSTTRLAWEPTRAEASPDGEMAVTVGTYRFLRPGEEGAPDDVLGRGRYLSVWKRQPDGSWKVWADVGSPASGE